jgi:hypothetical protein
MEVSLRNHGGKEEVRRMLSQKMMMAWWKWGLELRKTCHF